MTSQRQRELKRLHPPFHPQCTPGSTCRKTRGGCAPWSGHQHQQFRGGFSQPSAASSPSPPPPPTPAPSTSTPISPSARCEGRKRFVLSRLLVACCTAPLAPPIATAGQSPVTVKYMHTLHSDNSELSLQTDHPEQTPNTDLRHPSFNHCRI